MTLRKFVAPVFLFLVLTFILLVSPTVVRGFLPEQHVGTWVEGSALSVARTSASVTVMYDGRVLIAGGKDGSGEPVTNVDIVGMDGSVSSAAPMNIARAEHAAVWLYDGYVLVTGGTTRGGGVTNTAEMYDPLSDKWILLPAAMVDPRNGHTATNLPDGRVLIAGGNNGTNPLSSIETFSIVTEQFSFAGAMGSARQGLAAASLRNGNVLLIGGEDSDGAVVATSEIYVQDTNVLTGGPALSVARAAATATSLLDGRVLVTGGRNADGELASLEVIDANATSDQLLPVVMGTARAGHSAIRLTDNNQVLLVGGTSAGVAQNVAELYTPWTGELKTVAPMVAARTHPAFANLAIAGQAIVAGGGTATTETYAFATVSTDAVEYIPGQRVVVSGTGWQPGEEVNLSFHRTDKAVPDRTFIVVASGFGTISFDDFVLQSDDEYSHYQLTGRDAVSQAQTQFDDAVALTSVSVTSTPSANTAGNSFQFGLRLITSGNGNNTISGNLSLSSPPAGVSITSGAAYSIQGANTLNQTVTVGTTASVAGGQYTLTFANSTNSLTATGTLTINQRPAIETQPASQSISYPQNANFSIVATGYPAVSYQWYSSADHGATWAPVPGATSASYVITSPQTSLSGNLYRVTVSNAAGTTTSNSATLTVGRGTQTISFSGLLGKTFGEAPFAVSATASSGLAVSYGASGNCTIADSTVTINGAGSCTVTAIQAGDSNYNAATPVPQTFSIAKAEAMVTLSDLVHTFDGSPKTATVTTSPAGLATSIQYAGSQSAPVDWGSYQIIATITDPNYAGSATDTFVINRLPATLTFADLNQIYDGSPKTITVNSTPNGVPVTILYNGSANPPTNAGSYPVTARVANLNWDAPQISGTLTVAKANATVTLSGLSQSYDGSAQAVPATTVPVGLSTTITYDGSATVPTAAGSYTVVANVSDNNYSGSASGTLIISAKPASIALGNLNLTYDGAAKPVTVSTTPSGLPLSITYNGSPTVPTNAGTYAVVVSIDDSNYSGTSSGTLTIAKASASVVLSNLSHLYDGTQKAATASTSPTALPFTITYNGSSTAPTVAGDYAVSATVTDPNYSGIASGTMTIAKADQSIEFAQLAEQNIGVGQFTVSARASSGLAVSFSATGNCSISGSTVTVTGIGDCTVTAVQAGDTNYKAAAAVQQTVAIVGGTPAIVWAAPAPIVYGSGLTGAQLNAAANYSGTPLSGTYVYSPAAGAILSAGTHTLSVTFNPTNTAYNPVSSTVQINVAPATVTVTAPDVRRLYGDTNPMFTPQYSGLLSGDSVTAPANCVAAATSASRVGTYAITCSGAVATNYQFAYNAGVLTVSPVTLTVTPTNVSRPQGTANPTLTGTITGIRNSDPITASYSTTATTTSATGTYPITATLSDGGTGALSNYTPAPITGTLTVTNGKPDLVESVSVLTPSPVAGGTITIADTTSNVGGSSASSTVTRFYLVSGTSKIAALGIRSVPTIAALANSGPVNTNVILPTNLYGSYDVWACADDSSAVIESDESNNCSSSGITVGAPDLLVSSVAAPSSAISGGSIEVTDSVVNRGAAGALASTVRYYLLSRTARIASLGMRSVAALPAGASTGLVMTPLVLPGNLSGTFTVQACADDALQVTESDESNNCSSSSDMSIGAADLIVTAVTVPATANSGSPLTITDSTYNQGVADAKASVTRFYLVSGSTRVAVLGSRSVPVLAPKVSSGPISTQVALPGNMSGMFTIQTCADDTLAVVESDENNNCVSSSTIAISGADLLVSSVVAPTSASSGTVISVVDSTANQSNIDAKSSVTRFYLLNGSTRVAVLGSRIVPALPAWGTSGPVATGLTLPSKMTGAYSIQACADETLLVNESNEFNNCSLSATIVITK